jgi:hypothetical protein
VVGENKPIFGGNYFWQLLKQFSAVISVDATKNVISAKNYLALFSAATHRPPKLLRTYFGGFS